MSSPSSICAHIRQSPSWTTVEVAKLKAAYAQGGIHAAAAVLPGRGEGAIRSQAARHGIKSPYSPRSAISAKKFSSPEIDALIIAAHREGAVGWKGRLSLSLGCSGAWVSSRAAQLGLQATFTREPVWSAEELAIVAENAHQHCDTISRKLSQAGYKRSMGAVKRQVCLHGFDRHDPDAWTGTELGKLMGVSCHMVYKWMDSHGLKHTLGDGDTRPHRTTRRDDFKRWAIKNIDLIDLRKVDQVWFKDVMWGRA